MEGALCRRISRRRFLGAMAAVSSSLLGACDTPRQVEATAPTPTPAATPAMSLDVKIGQMLMVGFRGLEVSASAPIARDIRDRHLGGVVLFDYDVQRGEAVRNIESPSQVEALVASLQAQAGIPLFVSIDHEGGVITRLKEDYGFPPTVSHAHLGEADDVTLTHEKAAGMARTLAGLGINLNLAPVVDVNTNPDNPIIARYERSFSADPEVVSRHAIAFIRAHHEQGVLCTLKHFPGHGSSTGDTHDGVVDVTDTWSRAELEPYATIIEAGLADVVMTAHVYNAALDPEYPATLSRKTITGLLREELGYDGVVISDDMQMGAIATQYGFETAILKAIEAGIDLVAIANNLVYEEDIAARVIALIGRLVDEGVITETRIDESYQRIRRLKARLPAFEM